MVNLLGIQESKIWAFFTQKQEKNDHKFGAENKVRSNFILEKLMKLLLFNEVFKNLIFSSYIPKKLAL